MIFILILLGAATGVLGGVFGIGGNTIAIPILVKVFEYIFKFPAHLAMHMTIGTCIVTMLFTLLASAYNHYKRGNIVWPLYRQITPFMVVGAILGAILVKFVPAIILKQFFGVFLLIISLQMLLSKKNNKNSNPTIKHMNNVIMAIIAFTMGIISGLIGIGGGILLIPLFLYLNYQPKNVTATVSACAFTTGSAAAITILASTLNVNTHIPYAIGFVYLPAIIIMAPAIFFAVKFGTFLSIKINPLHLKKALITLLFILSLSMLI